MHWIIWFDYLVITLSIINIYISRSRTRFDFKLFLLVYLVLLVFRNGQFDNFIAAFIIAIYSSVKNKSFNLYTAIETGALNLYITHLLILLFSVVFGLKYADPVYYKLMLIGLIVLSFSLRHRIFRPAPSLDYTAKTIRMAFHLFYMSFALLFIPWLASEFQDLPQSVYSLLYFFCVIGVSIMLCRNIFENRLITALEPYKNLNTVEFYIDKIHVYKHLFSDFIGLNKDNLPVKNKLVQYENHINNDLFMKNLKRIKIKRISVVLRIFRWRCINEDICFNLFVEGNIKKLNMGYMDFLHILVTLFNNSYKATLKCTDKLINIQFIEDGINNGVYFSIDNTYRNEVPVTPGMGFKIFYYILSKYPEISYISNPDNNRFSHSLFIFND